MFKPVVPARWIRGQLCRAPAASALAISMLLCAPAHSLSINKTILEIDTASVVKKHEAFLTISNEKTEAVFVSATVSDWNVAADGKFVLSPTEAVKVSPSVVNLPPGGSATLRFTYSGDAQRPEQTGYRVQLKESPRLNIRQISEGLGTRLMLTANMTMPLFVTPKAVAMGAFDKVTVKWRLAGKTETGGSRLLVQVTNQGQRYVMAQTLFAGDKELTTPAQYVLPGNTVTIVKDVEGEVPEEAKLQVTLRHLDRTQTVQAIADPSLKLPPAEAPQ